MLHHAGDVDGGGGGGDDAARGARAGVCDGERARVRAGLCAMCSWRVSVVSVRGPAGGRVHTRWKTRGCSVFCVAGLPAWNCSRPCACRHAPCIVTRAPPSPPLQVSGAYFDKSAQKAPSAVALDEGAARTLWEASERMVAEVERRGAAVAEAHGTALGDDAALLGGDGGARQRGARGGGAPGAA